MTKTVATMRPFILLLIAGFPAHVLAVSLTCSVLGGSPYCAGGLAIVGYSCNSTTFLPDNVFAVQLSDATGSFGSPVIIGTLKTTSRNGFISVSFPESASGTGYRVRVVASEPGIVGSDNGSDIVINTLTNASVNITIDKPGAILCDTQTATFTAISTPGVAASYTWIRNGFMVGNNSSTYTATNFKDGDSVKVAMKSSAACAMPAVAVSNTIGITQKATTIPSVTISGPPFVCAGEYATLIAVPIGGGTEPSYQWKRNGNPIGTDSSTFTTNALIDGDILTTEMTSNGVCITQPVVASNSITANVTSTVVPSITIVADASTPVGTGSGVYFSSIVTGGGVSPGYKWMKNGSVVGTSDALFVQDINDKDEITATITSSANCAQPSTANSNTITLGVTDNMTPSHRAWLPRASQSDPAGTIVRVNGSGFSIGSKAYVGLGYVGQASNLRKDFWEYDPSTDTWSQKASFAGAARYNAVGFSLANKGYIATGITASGAVKDLYQYDPVTNTWKVRASLPNNARVRERAFGFSVATKAYLGGGYTSGFGDLKDFYEYDPSNNTWTPKANFAGGNRNGAASFTIGTKGYVAAGYCSTSTAWLKDFWEYDPAANVWTRRADMPGDGRSNATGFAVGGNGYVGLGNTSKGYDGQLFEYRVSTNSWQLRQYYPGPQTANEAIGMSIGDRAFIYKDGIWTEFNFFTMSSLSSRICTGESIPISFDLDDYESPPGTTFTLQISNNENFSVSTNLAILSSNATSGVIVANFLPTIVSDTYYLRIVTNSTPSLSTFTESINVTAVPVNQLITTPGGTSICKDALVVFSSNLSGPGFQWYKNGNPVGEDRPTYADVNLANDDVIDATKTYSVGCSQPTLVRSNALTMKVRTPATPVVTISQPNTLVSTEAMSYQWYTDGKAIDKATNQSYIMTESGAYKVKATDYSGCEAFSDEIKNAFTGLYDDELAGQILAYPNPVAGEMVLEIVDDILAKGVDYSLLNELGEIVIAPQKASRSNKINLTGRSSGLYLLRLSINGSTLVRRVVKVD